MDSRPVTATRDIPLAVRIERVRRRWRQIDLAVAVGVTQQDVSALERGCYVPPSRVQRILNVLGYEVRPDD